MFITQLIHTGQIALCAYGAHVSFLSIRNLQQYEETSKKAAKYSSTAEQQLHKTRSTQSSAAICVLVSLFAAVVLAVRPGSLPLFVRGCVSPGLLVGTLFVRAHVAGFWKDKARVPFVDGYVSFFLVFFSFFVFFFFLTLFFFSRLFFIYMLWL
jgi:hypothetical protein